MKRTFLAIAAVLAGTTAYAGGYTAPIIEAAAPAVAPVATPDTSWTNTYFGLQAGHSSTDFSGPGAAAANTGDFPHYGLHIGYQHEVGKLVLGGEVAYDLISPDVGKDGDIFSARARAGYDAGKFQPYVTVGLSHLDADVADVRESKNGITYGLGVEYRVADAFSVGADYTMTKWSDVSNTVVGSGTDMDAGRAQVRFSYRY